MELKSNTNKMRDFLENMKSFISDNIEDYPTLAG